MNWFEPGNLSAKMIKKLDRIEDDKKRSNVKSKRSKNLVKKCD